MTEVPCELLEDNQRPFPTSFHSSNKQKPFISPYAGRDTKLHSASPFKQTLGTVRYSSPPSLSTSPFLKDADSIAKERVLQLEIVQIYAAASLNTIRTTPGVAKANPIVETLQVKEQVCYCNLERRSPRESGAGSWP